MDLYLLFINYFFIYGMVVSYDGVRARKSQAEDKMRNPKQHSNKLMSRNKLLKSLVPVFKSSKSPESINFYPKQIIDVKSDDLLQDSPGLLGTFACPEGYRKRINGGTEFCSPTETEQEIAKAKPQCEGDQLFVDPRCMVAEHKTGLRACPDGSVKVVSQGKAHCVDQVSVTNTKCVKGTRLIDTDSGWKCDPIPVSEQPELSFANNKLPFRQKPSMELKSALKAKTEATHKPTCEDGKVAAMSQDGYICMEPVFPPSVCPEDRVPSVSPRGIQCVPCPSGQKVVRTEEGVKCETNPLAMTEIPCPEGLQSVQTSVGRICQFIPSPKAISVPKCSGGQQLNVSSGQMTCNQEGDCPPGYILVQSENGEKGCTKFNLTDESSCLEGEIFYEGACISIRLAEKFLGDSTIPCRRGYFLAVSNSGSVCQPNPDGQVIESQDPMLCEPGTIVTQTADGFRCLQGELPVYVIPMCGHNYVIARLGEMYKCISVNDAGLLCSVEEQMVRVDGGFVCEKAVHEKHCNSDEFYHTDQEGRTTCLSLLEASELCGDGYNPTNDNGFVCRRLVEDVSCPDGFVLSLDHGNPLCIEEGGDCYDIIESKSTGCLNQAPYCQPGYRINFGHDIPHCDLEFDNEPVTTDTKVQPCDADGMLRPCDLPAHLLLSGCNPDCANGGTCVNGSCVCPLGITGHACHIDVNECESDPCEYRCENTFGSYQCVCPTGMFLTTDGRTCTDPGCIPECLNNGECVRGQCRCTSSFEGRYCEIDKDECLKNGDRLCQHRCRNTYGGYTCICPPGSRLNRDGRTCLNTTCIPECRNGGACRNHRCYCPSGFYGIICQLDVNECRKDKPCNQNCENSWGSYRCSCDEGFMLNADERTCIQA